MQLTIRPGLPDDAPRLSALALHAKASWGYPSDWLGRWQDELTIAAPYLAEHQTFVAWMGGEAIGMCAIEDQGGHWTLEHLWVDPQHQGQNVGLALVQRVLEHVRATRPGIVTIMSDPHASGFYSHLGARQVGTKPAPMPGAPDRELPIFELRVEAA